jgi:hypothetical protein
VAKLDSSLIFKRWLGAEPDAIAAEAAALQQLEPERPSLADLAAESAGLIRSKPCSARFFIPSWLP